LVFQTIIAVYWPTYCADSAWHALKQPRIRRSLPVDLIAAITDRTFPSSGHCA